MFMSLVEDSEGVLVNCTLTCFHSGRMVTARLKKGQVQKSWHRLRGKLWLTSSIVIEIIAELNIRQATDHASDTFAAMLHHDP